MSQMSYEQAMNKVMVICSKAEKCVSDIEKKLLGWEVAPEAIQKILIVLQKEKFIDENRYTSYYVNDKFRFNKWGKIKIGFMLKAKNIPRVIIQDALDQIDQQVYLFTLQQLLLQKRKSTTAQSDYELKAKLTRFAQGKGFEYEAINKVLSDL